MDYILKNLLVSLVLYFIGKKKKEKEIWIVLIGSVLWLIFRFIEMVC